MYSLKKTKFNQNFPITIINAKEQKAFIGVDGKSEQETRILPEGYTQVEYITSDGNSYIDTNLQINGDFEIDLDFIKNQSSSGEQPIISIWTSQYNYWNLYIKTNNVLEWYVAGHYIADNNALTQGVKNKVTLKRSGNDFTFKQNNSSTTFTYSNDNNTTTLKLFNRGDLNGSSTVSIGAVSIKKSNVLVMKLIPCYRNSDTVIGMYDIVNDIFYTNAGTGTFLKGNDVSIPNPEYPSEIHSVADDVNLYDIENANVSNLGSNITVTKKNDTVKMVCNGTVYGAILGNVTLGKVQEYTIACDVEGGVETQLQWGLRVKFQDNTYSNVSNSNKLTFTTKQKNEQIQLMFYVRVGQDFTGTVILSNIKLQEGTTATPYSPYNQGTVTIKQRGKNLFTISNFQKSGWNIAIDNPMKDLEPGQYTISCVNEYKQNAGMAVAFSNEPFGSVVGVYFVGYDFGNGTKYSNTQTITQEHIQAQYMRIFPQDSGVTQEILENMQIQIEEGEKTSYEPYQGNDYTIQTEPLRSLPNGVKDTIEEDGIHRRVGRVVLDGSENWQQYNNNVYFVGINRR